MSFNIAIFGAFGGACLPLLSKALLLINGKTFPQLFPGTENVMGWMAGLVVVAFIGAFVAIAIEASHPHFRAITTGLTLPATISALAGGTALVSFHAFGLVGSAMAQSPAKAESNIGGAGKVDLNRVCKEKCVLVYTDKGGKILRLHTIQYPDAVIAIPADVPSDATSVQITYTADKTPSTVIIPLIRHENMTVSRAQPQPGFAVGFLDALGILPAASYPASTLQIWQSHEQIPEK